jgi:hypothetical protein
MPADETIATPPPAAPSPVHARRCENCGAPLYGEHCHACGQPTKGLVRHFSSVLGDFFDTVFNIDSRVLRTIGPLLTRPGFLSLEYFAGRRVRYVTPMRLFLFLSLVMFFAIQGSIEIKEQGDTTQVEVSSNEIEKATTPEQVEAISRDALRELDRARKEVQNVPGGTVGIDIARDKLKDRADRQIAYLKSVDAARLAGRPLPQAPKDGDRKIDFPVNGKPWDPKTNPVNFAWLPAPLNAALNRRMGHARDVLKTSNSEKPWLDALFNVLPQTLIVLMPMFALMLKLAYWFKRRLYMEHLIVALHSHSFISLALTLVIAFSWLREWLAPDPGFWNGIFGWAMGLTTVWIPVYLLLMQKRVYGQGWLMTLIKYCVLGLCYSVLLSVGLVAAMLIGLLTL